MGTPLTRGPRVIRLTDTESRRRDRGQGSGWGSVSHGDRVSAWGMERSGAGGGDGHRVTWMCSVPLNWTLKRVEIITFTLCIFSTIKCH